MSSYHFFAYFSELKVLIFLVQGVGEMPEELLDLFKKLPHFGRHLAHKAGVLLCCHQAGVDRRRVSDVLKRGTDRIVSPVPNPV